MSLQRNAAAALAGLLLCAPAQVWAQDKIDELEATLQQVAQQSIPKTVLIKAIVSGGRMGAGSGALISDDGYLLTCSHVVEIGGELEVVTSDGRTFKGQLLGRNKRQDYALVKIDATGLDHFTVADSDTVKPGDWVVALGHPGGPYPDVQPAFAAGKVRDLDRKLPVGFMSKYYNHAIMTDVPIFAGDSGGPLVNLSGELVGINGAIVMINEFAFAIPTNQIMPHLAELKAGTVIEGEPAGPEAFRAMQDLISPEDYQRMLQRSMKKLFGGGEDSPLAKLFGGENSPFKDLFGGGNGEMPDFSKLFGGGNGEMPDFSKLFGGGNGEMPDLSKLFGEGSPFKDLFGGGNGEMPDLSKLFGGGNGEMPDLSELFGEGSPFKDLFGGGNGEMPDLGKLFGGGNGEMPDLGELFGGGERPAAPPAAPKAVLGVRIRQPASQAGGQAGGLGGVLVEAVAEGSPAEQAGLRKGDLIVSIDEARTPHVRALTRAMSDKRPGQTVSIEVRRTVLLDVVPVERSVTLQATLGSR